MIRAIRKWLESRRQSAERASLLAERLDRVCGLVSALEADADEIRRLRVELSRAPRIVYVHVPPQALQEDALRTTVRAMCQDYYYRRSRGVVSSGLVAVDRKLFQEMVAATGVTQEVDGSPRRARPK